MARTEFNSFGGLPILLCAEADHPDFDNLPEEEQAVHYCHRFTLAKRLASRMRTLHGDITVEMVHLDIAEFQHQVRLRGRYEPRTTQL